MNNQVILVVEDESAICNLVTTTLEAEGYRCHVARNGKQALIEAGTCYPALILLDLGLPDMDGIDVIKKIRSWSQVPITVISARSEDKDKIDALDAGADDYLTKPFSTAELLARIRGTFRRIEYMILCLLAKNIGRVLTNTYITKEIWGSSVEGDIASLRVHIATVRKKIEKADSSNSCIRTHIGIGYCMVKAE